MIEQRTSRLPYQVGIMLVGWLLIVAISPAYSFDHERKGLVLGIGSGINPLSSLRGTDDSVELKENGFGIGYSFLIGVGFTSSDLLALDVNGSFFSSDLYGDSSMQIFRGVSWYHYFGNPGRSAFGALGYGYYVYEWQGSRHYICWGDDCDPPPRLPSSYTKRKGYLAGGGYEFNKHWQVGAFITGGNDDGDSGFSFVHVNILIQYTWY